jgi:Lipocalin-like domain
MRTFGIVLFILWTSCAHANEALLGNWKLVSFFTEDTQTKQRNNVYGEKPTGSIGFTPAGRFFGFVTAEGRKPALTGEEQAAAFRSMLAYTGKWRVEGDKFITAVDIAWNPAWVGTEQVRYWRLDGNKLFITTAPIPNPSAAGSTMIGTLIWEKE